MATFGSHATLPLGERARTAQDQTDGTKEKGLKKSIADAYAAFIGQTDQLPNDSYGLALYGLTRAYAVGHWATGMHDFNLQTSPFVTSKSKHAAIYNAAHHIMDYLDDYVGKVVPYTPPPLRSLMKHLPTSSRPTHTHTSMQQTATRTIRPDTQPKDTRRFLGAQSTHPARQKEPGYTHAHAAAPGKLAMPVAGDVGMVAGSKKGLVQGGSGAGPAKARSGDSKSDTQQGALSKDPRPLSAQQAPTLAAQHGQGNYVVSRRTTQHAAFVPNTDLATAATMRAAAETVASRQPQPARRRSGEQPDSPVAATGSQQVAALVTFPRVHHVPPHMQVAERYRDRGYKDMMKTIAAALAGTAHMQGGTQTHQLQSQGTHNTGPHNGNPPGTAHSGHATHQSVRTQHGPKNEVVTPQQMALAHKVLGHTVPDQSATTTQASDVDTYPYRSPSPHGTHGHHSSRPRSSPGHTSVSAALGLTVSDDQLLRIIHMFQDKHRSVQEQEAARALATQFVPGPDNCAPGRSQRRHPTNEQLLLSRTFGVPVCDVDAYMHSMVGASLYGSGHGPWKGSQGVNSVAGMAQPPASTAAPPVSPTAQQPQPATGHPTASKAADAAQSASAASTATASAPGVSGGVAAASGAPLPHGGAAGALPVPAPSPAPVQHNQHAVDPAAKGHSVLSVHADVPASTAAAGVPTASASAATADNRSRRLL